ncbi:hypothetical protein STEG23_030006, partial [Scotinomys teguina]
EGTPSSESSLSAGHGSIHLQFGHKRRRQEELEDSLLYRVRYRFPGERGPPPVSSEGHEWERFILTTGPGKTGETSGYDVNTDFEKSTFNLFSNISCQIVKGPEFNSFTRTCQFCGYATSQSFWGTHREKENLPTAGTNHCGKAKMKLSESQKPAASTMITITPRCSCFSGFTILPSPVSCVNREPDGSFGG